MVEHGTIPNDDVYAELKDGSVNRGEVDIDAFVRLTPQRLLTDPAGRGTAPAAADYCFAAV